MCGFGSFFRTAVVNSVLDFFSLNHLSNSGRQVRSIHQPVGSIGERGAWEMNWQKSSSVLSAKIQSAIPARSGTSTLWHYPSFPLPHNPPFKAPWRIILEWLLYRMTCQNHAISSWQLPEQVKIQCKIKKFLKPKSLILIFSSFSSILWAKCILVVDSSLKRNSLLKCALFNR